MKTDAMMGRGHPNTLRVPSKTKRMSIPPNQRSNWVAAPPLNTISLKVTIRWINEIIERKMNNPSKRCIHQALSPFFEGWRRKMRTKAKAK